MPSNDSAFSTEPGPSTAAGRAIARLCGRVGRRTLRALGDVGRLSIFVGRSLARVPRRRLRIVQTILQVEFVGARSVGVVALSAVFTGLVLALQGYNVLVRFGSENMVGSLVALSLTRELAPVLTAIMVTARAGSAMAATIGNMAVTEQLDALGSLAVDPLHYLVVPRLLASVTVVPLLTALFSVAGIAAAYFFGVSILGLDHLAFMSNIRSSMEWKDVSVGLWKAVLFGLLIACIATYRGFQTRGGATGVGRATSRTVVETAVLILSGDFVVTALFF
ncbi:MAG TPA: ABC transporter permease [Polyangia bacterium]|jgi:phospholipid/cholesterol/gamma-HCH transport system permease protein|nr:ABC transporter permease [Polyangia bacterium]